MQGGGTQSACLNQALTVRGQVMGQDASAMSATDKAEAEAAASQAGVMDGMR